MIPVTLFSGKMSIFGGLHDLDMKPEEGLSIYEHHEADKRPDLFFPRYANLKLGTSKRLKDDALFFACRFPLNVIPRATLQKTRWPFRNPVSGKTVALWLVDFGPNQKTDRLFDISKAAAKTLGLKTDDVVEALPFVV